MRCDVADAKAAAASYWSSVLPTRCAVQSARVDTEQQRREAKRFSVASRRSMDGPLRCSAELCSARLNGSAAQRTELHAHSQPHPSVRMHCTALLCAVLCAYKRTLVGLWLAVGKRHASWQQQLYRVSCPVPSRLVLSASSHSTTSQRSASQRIAVHFA